MQSDFQSSKMLIKANEVGSIMGFAYLYLDIQGEKN
jgi:hypothetical protein